jgi:aminoglycoside phosphotransferase (APT) family kinase protein
MEQLRVSDPLLSLDTCSVHVHQMGSARQTGGQRQQLDAVKQCEGMKHIYVTKTGAEHPPTSNQALPMRRLGDQAFIMPSTQQTFLNHVAEHARWHAWSIAHTPPAGRPTVVQHG